VDWSLLRPKVKLLRKDLGYRNNYVGRIWTSGASSHKRPGLLLCNGHKLFGPIHLHLVYPRFSKTHSAAELLLCAPGDVAEMAVELL